MTNVSASITFTYYIHITTYIYFLNICRLKAKNTASAVIYVKS